MLNQPSEVVGGERHRGESAAVRIHGDAVSLADPLRERLARQDDVDHSPFLIHKGVGGHHLEAEQPSNQVGLHLVRGVHRSQAQHVELGQSGRRR